MLNNVNKQHIPTNIYKRHINYKHKSTIIDKHKTDIINDIIDDIIDDIINEPKKIRIHEMIYKIANRRAIEINFILCIFVLNLLV